ncbi:hypothetical protein QTQ03_25345 [Micromonospora sp. WMMA1363]|uniref:hypothetical protein n=1 Tax=Micromonospora sp. WMMA1363 TaxID=3053985 RepID=UPI00259CE56F|nr:hypothetical protein [Micromonospora sp. WMMA1363]MDM4722761.1 hypothetical protein [Micromonospora sp. WMMA1363]
MADLVVVVPSRGRPQAAEELARAFAVTCIADTKLLFAVDESDSTGGEYPGWKITSPTHTMVEALNAAADYLLNRDLLGSPPPVAVGFQGDDHRPRTKGWDQAYLDALRELGTGIVYGDDRYQGERLPTQCAMTADIIRALGYMAPPSLTHMYVDNFWLGLGRAAGCIRYLPDVVVEHMHPYAGKADMDAGYERVNDRRMYAKDEAAYLNYCGTRMTADVAAVAGLRGARVGA